MSNFLQLPGLQHIRLLCPPLSPGVCSNSCPLGQWCHPTNSSFAAPFSFCLQSFPASGSFPMSQLFALGSQSIGASASASVLPMNIQGWFPLGLTGWISLQSKGLSRVFFSSVHSVVSKSLWPQELQRAMPPCPTPTPGAYPNSCPLNRWCDPIISSSVVPFSSCPQSFPASGSFQMSQFFTSGGQSIGVSASTSVLPMNIQDWFPLRWIGWISLQSKELSRVFFNMIVQKHQFFGTQLSL